MKRVLPVLLAALLALPVPGFAQQASEHQEINQAWTYLEARQFNKAEELLKKAYRNTPWGPVNAELHFALSAIFFEKRNAMASYQWLADAVRTREERHFDWQPGDGWDRRIDARKQFIERNFGIVKLQLPRGKAVPPLKDPIVRDPLVQEFAQDIAAEVAAAGKEGQSTMWLVVPKGTYWVGDALLTVEEGRLDINQAVEWQLESDVGRARADYKERSEALLAGNSTAEKKLEELRAAQVAAEAHATQQQVEAKKAEQEAKAAAAAEEARQKAEMLAKQEEMARESERLAAEAEARKSETEAQKKAEEQALAQSLEDAKAAQEAKARAEAEAQARREARAASISGLGGGARVAGGAGVVVGMKVRGESDSAGVAAGVDVEGGYDIGIPDTPLAIRFGAQYSLLPVPACATRQTSSHLGGLHVGPRLAAGIASRAWLTGAAGLRVGGGRAELDSDVRQACAEDHLTGTDGGWALRLGDDTVNGTVSLAELGWNGGIFAVGPFVEVGLVGAPQDGGPRIGFGVQLAYDRMIPVLDDARTVRYVASTNGSIVSTEVSALDGRASLGRFTVGVRGVLLVP